MNLDHLAQLATEASPGPWFCVVNDLVGGKAVGNRNKPVSQYDHSVYERVIADLTADDSDAAFIAAANPETVTALVEVARAARECQSACDLAPTKTLADRQWCCAHGEWTPCSFVDLVDALAKLDNLEGAE